MRAGTHSRFLSSLHTGVLAFLLALAPGSGHAQSAPPPSRGGISVIDIRGPITTEHRTKLRRALEASDPDRYPAGAILLLDSPGGDGLVAMEIGRMARAARAQAFVRGRCASACVLILAGSVVRGIARDQTVGIHQGRLTTVRRNVGEVTVDTAANPEAARVLEVANGLMEEYLREMGLPDALFQAMMAAPVDKMHNMTLTETATLGLSGFDPIYRSQRVPAGAAHYRITPGEFEQRTLQVPATCITDKVTPQEFVRCYQRVLRTGG